MYIYDLTLCATSVMFIFILGNMKFSSNCNAWETLFHFSNGVATNMYLCCVECYFIYAYHKTFPHFAHGRGGGGGTLVPHFYDHHLFSQCWPLLLGTIFLLPLLKSINCILPYPLRFFLNETLLIHDFLYLDSRM